MKLLLPTLLLALASAAPAQEAEDPLRRAEREGIEVRIKDIARFRGVRPNQLMGFGLVIGLEGTGDTRRTPFTQKMLENALKDYGIDVNSAQFNPKNIAAVTVTAELPAFAAPGNQIDVTVQSVGDAKSLRGGVLLQTPLFAAGRKDVAYVVAQGAVSIGGFGAEASGSSVTKNLLTAGRVPAGGIVEASVPTKTVFGGRMYLELDEADFTTAQRLSEALNRHLPQFGARPADAGSIELSLPDGMSDVQAKALVEQTTVFADIPALVVINENTGTIVVGGNVKIGPAVVAHAGLSIRIDTQNDVVQPAPLSLGTSQKVSNSLINATEDTTQVAVIKPGTTIADLAKILQELRLTSTDINAILQMLKKQGALKARIRMGG